MNSNDAFTDTVSAAQLSEYARAAILISAPISTELNEDPNTNHNSANRTSIAIAKSFLSHSCPEYLEKFRDDEDRLIKIGRSVADLATVEGDKEGKGLALLVRECAVLATGLVKVPRVRFGRTNLSMPIVSLGTMRFQQTWAQSIKDIAKVNKDCQANLVQILKYAILELGMVHIETARSYGCSDLQLGQALKEMFRSGKVKREDLIIQVKVAPVPSVEEFRQLTKTTFENLQIDYADLFAFHGLNLHVHHDILFKNTDEVGGSLMDVVDEYRATGKVRNVGFSTHGQPELIRGFIETGKFDYINLHYNAFGSYTSSGGGIYGGNLENIRLARERDMGVFIISPFDKGGKLFAPSKKLRSLTLPEMEPVAYQSSWLWNHSRHDSENAPIHTIVCGAARPSDLDQQAIAAYLHGHPNITDQIYQDTMKVAKRIQNAAVEVLGEDWANTWYEGVPNCLTMDQSINFGHLVWLHNIVKAYGLIDYARERYRTIAEFNSGKFKAVKDKNLSTCESINKIGRVGWGFGPGCAIVPGKDYSEELAKVPEANKEKVLKALEFVHMWCTTSCEKDLPKEWETAYDMRPWVAFPERK